MTVTAPITDDAAMLDLIDAQLISLLAIAYFGPAEQGTSESVRQACAAEVLLHRLRMSRRAVAELRDALNLPARQGDPSVAVAAAVGFPLSPDGPGSNHPLAPGEEPTPGSAVAALSGAAARESTRAVVADGAGADVPGAEGLGCKGRVVGADGAATFTNPDTRVPLRFDEGEHRLVGAVHQP